jgi:aldehyde:ferredoxin oxidoreductase
MQLSKEVIEEFKQIYKQEFGEEISDQEAMEKATRLINLMRIICKRIPEDKKDEYPSS